jgi:hypothetical protein
VERVHALEVGLVEGGEHAPGVPAVNAIVVVLANVVGEVVRSSSTS